MTLCEATGQNVCCAACARGAPRAGKKDFPEISVLPRLPSGHLAVYREHAKPPRIELSKALGLADVKTRRYVILHEIGHWFRRAYVPGLYSRHAEERFAHSFAAFILAPRAFAQSEPNEYAKMSVLIETSDRVKISRFARTVLSRLQAKQR